MARRSIKIPPKEAGSETSSDVEKFNDVLNSLDSIQAKRKVAASSSGANGNTVKPATIIMAVVIVGIAATLLLSFGSLPAPDTEGQTVLADLDFEIELLNGTSYYLSLKQEVITQ